MKQKFYYLFLFLPLLAFLLGACSDKDEVLGSGNTGVISFQADLGKKGFTRGTLDHTFDGTEQIAITMRAVDANANGWPTPRHYVANGEGQLSHSPQAANDANDVPWYWPNDADAIEVKGWYTADQYRSAVNGEQFSVPADQHVRLDIQGYDFLYAPATTFSDRTASSLLLPFWHEMCLVRIYVESLVPFTDEEISTVKLFGTDWKQNGTYTEPTGEATHGSWSTTTGTAFTQGITPMRVATSNDGKTVLFLAMIVPQQTRGRQLISFVRDNTTFTYTLPATEEASPDFMPGMVYTYNLPLGQDISVTASPWDPDPLTPFSATPNPWDPGDGLPTTANVNPWLPGDAPTGVDFWIVDWLSEDPTALIDYITLRQGVDEATIPVSTKDTLMYSDGYYYYSHGGSTGNLSWLDADDAPSTINSDRTEGYTKWYLLEWERNQAGSLPKKNTASLGPWAFGVDDNVQLKGKSINALRLKSASAGEKTIKLFVKRKDTAIPTSETPAATATFKATYDGEEVIAKFSKTLKLGDYEYLVIDAPDNTFYLDDTFREKFFFKANTVNWCEYGSSLGIDVGYLAAPMTDGAGTWFITSSTDNSDKLEDSRESAAAPFAGYVYPLTMQARLRGHAFNAFRFKCKTPGSFTATAVKRNGTDARKLGTVSVTSPTFNDKLVFCYLRDDDNAITSATLADDEYLVIGGHLSNYYSAAGGTFSDYNASSFYLYGPEGYYTIEDNSAMGTWTWGGNQEGLLGVDVGYVANPNP